MSAVETTAVYPIARQHVYGAILALLFAISVSVFIAYDRAAPFVYVNTEITPAVATKGGVITIHRHTIWQRHCEGEAWTEIVGADRIINFYDKGLRFPFELGETQVDRTITLSQSIAPGRATYRGIIRFRSCGLTSRWRPIDVPYQEVDFDIR